ncbi:MAG TPA: AAA family ATPase [Candidatus Hydrogenedentes bacterium]|nr:AAA family ATPase [Candidatus Hydrogenedentota bacterium]
MKIQRVNILGYGRFSNLALEFAPGFQVIIGPNEQGKSTLRSFVGDILYGQKRSATQRIYDESHALHVPWEDPERYGGSLVYALDTGVEMEVVRMFDKRRESVQVFDRTHGQDITGEFVQLRNHEVDFATQHLGLTKEVFLGTATISHFSLEDLGDRDALNQIREKLLSLADSGEESSSAEAALKRLQERIMSIGQPNARTKPLPSARARCALLEQELSQACMIHAELAEVAERRHAALMELEMLRIRRGGLEEELRVLEAQDRAARLREAENLSVRIDTATQHCFALGSARDFPLEREGEIQEVEGRVTAAKAHLARTLAEQDELTRQRDMERKNLGDESALSLEDLPENIENRFNEITTNLQRFRDRHTEMDANADELRKRMEDAQRAMAGLPDFSRMAQDPVEWMTQLASSFSLALRSRDEECEARDKLRAETEHRRAALARAQALFREHTDFPDMAREYELRKRMGEEQIAQRSQYLHSLEAVREEETDRLPGFFWMTVLSILGILILAGAFLFTGNKAILLPGAVLLVAIAYFLARLAYGRARLGQVARQIAEAQAELEALKTETITERHPVEALMEQAGCETIRELEAMYDQYRSASAELAARLEVLEAQETRAEETQERVPQLLERIREAFAKAGQTVQTEKDVQTALSGAIASYQEYREHRRRVNDTRSMLDRNQNEMKRLAEHIADTERALADVEQEIRSFLRINGFNEENQYENAAGALRAYRSRTAQHRERRGRMDLLAERALLLERQVEEDRATLDAREKELARILTQAGVVSVDQWHGKAKQAREYRDVWTKRGNLEEQLNSVLRGQSLHALREAVQNDGPLSDMPKRPHGQIKAELEETTAAIEQRMKEERELHIRITERSAALRSINEIEEERATLEGRIRSLEFELTAAAHALALIEDIARDKHARIAPKLAARAGDYIKQITGGAYDELYLSRDLTISVRIPQTSRLAENPEKSLSKGTVDQIYLALRLALVQGISETGETIPMLLDDPFANYDDVRLEHTMKLMADIGQQNQILLFTCREDVVRAAQIVNAPVIRL